MQMEAPNDFDHNVTYQNTIKHWVLYTLDAIEASYEPDPDDEDGVNIARRDGIYPDEVYDFAAGEESIVFSNRLEVGGALSEMARMERGEDDARPVNRRTNRMEWSEPDVKYLYRLTEFGRNVLLDLGVPDKLPNRQDADESDRELDGAQPSHQPGWWQDDFEDIPDEWDIGDNDWIETNNPRLFYKDEGSAQLCKERGYTTLGVELAEAFDGVTFVLSCGPYRTHDITYAIRDPFEQVVQIDVYSPMAMHRSSDEISQSFNSLVEDLWHALNNLDDGDGD